MNTVESPASSFRVMARNQIVWRGMAVGVTGVLVALLAILLKRPGQGPAVPPRVAPPVSVRPDAGVPTPRPPAVLSERPLPPEFRVGYALPKEVGNLDSTGLRTPEVRGLTDAERAFFGRLQRGAALPDPVEGPPRVLGSRGAPRELTEWDEFLERWVDPRLQRDTGLGLFRPDAAYEALKLPFQQRESGFSLGIKYRWTF